MSPPKRSKSSDDRIGWVAAHFSAKPRSSFCVATQELGYSRMAVHRTLHNDLHRLHPYTKYQPHRVQEGRKSKRNSGFSSASGSLCKTKISANVPVSPGLMKRVGHWFLMSTGTTFAGGPRPTLTYAAHVLDQNVFSQKLRKKKLLLKLRMVETFSELRTDGMFL